MSEMHSPLGMKERRASLFDEGTSGIREFHNPSCVASEQVKSMLCFEVGNLFAERRLGYVQSVRSPCEVQLFGQDDDSVQVTDFEVGEHGANSQVFDISHASSREAVHILIDFRTRMIGFLFGGPDSGQQLGRRWTWRFVTGASERSVIERFIVVRKIL